MRIILKIVFFILIGFSAKAQIFQTNNAPYKFRGLKADTVLILPKGCDTPYLSNPKWGTSSGGALFADTCNNKLFLFNGVQWNEISGGGGSALDTISFRAGSVLDTLYYVQDGDTTDFYYVVVRDGLISGGVVTYSGFDLTYYVSAAVYRKGGVFYTTNDTTITIPPLSNTDSSRIDIFVVNTSGEATTIQGTEGANPVSPQIDPDTDVYLTFIELSPTNQNAGVDTVQIYDENLGPPDEWTGGSSGLGAFNLNGATNVYRGAKTTDVGAINSGDIFGYRNTTTVNRQDYEGISFFIRLKQVMPNNNTLFISFWNGGVLSASELAVPINKTNTTSYQAFTMGFDQFTWANSLFDSVRFRYSGGGAGISGLYIDNIYLQSGLTVPGGATDTTNLSYRIDTLAADINNISSPICGFYDFSTTTTASDPGSGRLRLNNATYASVTQVYVSQTTNPGTDVTNLLGALKTGDFVYIQDKDNSTQFFRAVITSTTDNGTWWTLAVNDVTSGGSLFSNNADLGVCLLFGGEGLDTTGTGDLYIRNLRTPQENKTFNVVAGHLDSLYASGSGGLHLVSNNGTQVANFGAGGGSSAVFNGFSGYKSNIAANYTARSFTDKNYVDSSILAGGGGGFTNPMTTTGDIIYSSNNSGTPARLGIGSTGNFLTVTGGIPAWSQNTTGVLYIPSDKAYVGTTAGKGSNGTDGGLNASGHNMFIGDSAGHSINTGVGNVAFGYRAAYSLRYDSGAVAIGYNALSSLDSITGLLKTGNIAIGRNALRFYTQNATSLLPSVAVGSNALENSTTNLANVAIGPNVLRALTTQGNGNVGVGLAVFTSLAGNSSENVGLGFRAAELMTSGTGVFALGALALQNATTVSNTIAIGGSALRNPTGTISNTVAIGPSAMIGGSASSGVQNTAIGVSVFQNYTSGQENTGVGFQSGLSLTSGSQNTYLGTSAGFSNLTGSHNTLIGRAAGNVVTAGNNTLIGSSSASNVSARSLTTGTGNIAIGSFSVLPSGTSTNQVSFWVNGSGGYNVLTRFTGGGWLFNQTTSEVTTQTTSAAVEINGTTGALLLPRLTTTQRDALTATNGMIIYNTTTSKFQGYAGGTWLDFH